MKNANTSNPSLFKEVLGFSLIPRFFLLVSKNVLMKILFLPIIIAILLAPYKNAWSGESTKSFPRPLVGTFDPALMEAIKNRKLPKIPRGAPLCATRTRRPRRGPQVTKPCHDEIDRNDTAPFLYGDTYVIHIYVKDKDGSWSTSSWNPFDHTRESEAANVRLATEWIESKSPPDLHVSFNTSNTDSYFFYNVTISGTIEDDDDEDKMIIDIPKKIGFSDSDNDGEYLDDMLEYLRTLRGGGWENVIAVFHLNHSSRSFALSDKAATACFTTNDVWGTSTPIIPRTYAHEMLHLYGASDEYYDPDKGRCGGGYCDEDYPNDWIEPVYKNGNCASCGDDPSCLMRSAFENIWGIFILGDDISLCSFTKGHIGWKDYDSDGDRDLEESLPWVELSSWPSGETTNPVVNVSGTAYTAFRWTHISAVEYRIVGVTGWTSATATDGTWDGVSEAFSFTHNLSSDGTFTFEVRAKNAKGLVQNCNYFSSFTITLDTTPPPAPVITSDSHPDSSTWYSVKDIKAHWAKPYDVSGIGGYSMIFDQNASTIPPTTISTTSRFHYFDDNADGIWHLHVRAVDELGNWGQTAHLKFRIDTTPPTVPNITSSTHGEDLYSNASTASFSWSSTDAHSGVAGYAWNTELDQDPYGIIGTDWHYSDTSADLTVPAPPDGDYYFHVRAVDNAGNWSDVDDYRIRADLTPPSLSVNSTSHPNPTTWYSNADVTYKWTDTAWDLSGILGYSYKDTIDYGWVLPNKTANTNQSSVTLMGLESGHHYFGVHALDNAGNWGSDAGVIDGVARTSVRIDVTPPDTVTNLNSPSHSNAIGQYDCTESANNVVSVEWTIANDAHSHVKGYAIAWNHNPDQGPDNVQTLDRTSTNTSSPPLEDDNDWYFHISTVDSAGNWSEDFATIGPFFIKRTPPPAPGGVTPEPGNATVTIKWRKVQGVPNVTYNAYRRQEGGSYGSPVASALVDTFFTQNWPSVLNGDLYYYVVTSLDSCNIESDMSAEVNAMPEYQSPNTGVRWNLTNLKNNSKGGIRGVAPTFTMHGTVTISQTDTLVISPGRTLTSKDLTGTKELKILGTLIAQGSEASPIIFRAEWPSPGNWGGLYLFNPGSPSIIEHCYVRYAKTGIYWSGGDPFVRNCVIERCSQSGIAVSPAPGLTCTIDSSTVRYCNQTGIYIFGSPNSTTQINDNEVKKNATGIFYDVNPNAQPPLALNIASNNVTGNSGDGIVCGNGGVNITVQDNIVLENQNGIVFNSEGWLIAKPLIQNNNVSGNSNAGIFTAQQASPDVKNNRIVQNTLYGCYSRTNAFPTYTGNTITGSTYGVYVENSPVAVPDFGNNTPASPGMNRLDGHSTAWIWNNGGAAMNAIINWWGSAQGNPAAVIGGAMPVNWNPVWNVVNQAPSLTITAPNGGTALDSVIVKWTDSDPDSADNATINFYYDSDSSGLDGTQIVGASNLSEDDEADSLIWNTRLIPAGTYFVYGIISDDAQSSNAYSPGSITIKHPEIAVAPDSLHATIEPGASQSDSLTVRNDGTWSLSASLESNASWLVLGDSSASLAAGESTTVTVTFDASSLSDGDYSTTIEIASDDHIDSLVTIPATLRIEKPEISLSASSIDFSGVQVDSTESESLEIFNTGSAALVITGLEISPPFYVSGSSTPDTIAAGDTLALTISYTPSAPQTDTDSLTIDSSDSDESTLKVALSGIGLDPEVSVSDTTHAFGTIAVGDTASWSFTIVNDGTSDLLLSSASFDTSGFSVASPQFAASVSPGESLEVAIDFNPSQARDYSATLSIATNDADESQVDLSLSGTGALPEAVLSNVPVDFGSVRANTSTDRPIWVRNDGEDTLTVKSASTDSPFSVVSPSLPQNIMAGDSLQITLRFTPLSPDSSSEDLYVSTNSIITPVLSATLTGVGVAPNIVFSDSSIEFGAVHADSSDTLLIRLYNQGNDSLTVTSLALSGASNFNLDAPSTPLVITPGDSASVEVVFPSSPVGSYLDTLIIQSDDPDLSPASIPVSAQSVSPEVSVVLLITTPTGPEEAALPPGGYDFGGSPLDKKTVRSFRIRNNGGYALRVDSILVAPSDFALEDSLSLPDTIEAGGYLPFTLSFITDTTIALAGSLTVMTNDRETSSLSIPLAGHGVEVVAGLYPDSIGAFVIEGDSTDVQLHFTNAGEGTYLYLIRVKDSSSVALSLGARPAMGAMGVDFQRKGGNDFQLHRFGEAAAASGVDWISIPDSLGWVRGVDTVDVDIQLNADSLSPGKYNATLVIYTSDPDMDSTSVPITLQVEESPVTNLITNFAAKTTSTGVELEWVITSDNRVKGIKIYREQEDEEIDELLNPTRLIPFTSRTYIDKTVRGNTTYLYTLNIVLDKGTEVRSQTVKIKTKPYALALRQNYPNPFNPVTIISFTLPKSMRVQISIYNLEGRLVLNLLDKTLSEGLNTVAWDGRNALGNPVSSGLYFYRLRAGGRVFTKKMVLLK